MQPTEYNSSSEAPIKESASIEKSPDSAVVNGLENGRPRDRPLNSPTPKRPLQNPKFWIAITIAGLAVILLFFFNLCYFYGTLYHQTSRTYALKILMVDFDGDFTVPNSIGQSMQVGYDALSDLTFPTFIIKNSSEFSSPADLIPLIREQKYWGAIYINFNASSQLSSAIAGNLPIYNPNTAITTIFNEIRYPAVSLGMIRPAFFQLIGATTNIYQLNHAQTSLLALSTAPNATKQVATQALFTPLKSTEINIRPAPQTEKNLYNTVSLAIPIVQMFFYLVALNGICESFHLFTSLPLLHSTLIRHSISLAFTFLASLSSTTYIFVFRESWALPLSPGFGRTWMVFWILMHIYYLQWETITAFVPMAAMPFLIVTWLFMSIGSAMSPMELMPGFYRWSQAVPAFEALQLLWDVWGGGGNKVEQAVPVLLAWWVVWFVGTTVGFRARRKAEREERSLSH